MTTDLEPVVDSTAGWLDELHIPHRYLEAIDMTLIDDKASLANQARRDPIIVEVVERYTDDMRRGDTFPPVIVRGRPRSPRFTVLSGNHRVAAARTAGVKLAAHVVECTDEIALRIAYEDNRRHGLPPSDVERLDQAVHLIALGWTQGAAAAAVGVSENKVSRARAAVEAAQRATALDVEGFGRLGATTRSRLSSLRSDPVFAAASKLVLEADLGTEHVYPLVTELNDTRSDDAALKLIDSKRDEHLERIQIAAAGKTVKRGAATSPRARLTGALGVIASVDPKVIASGTLPDQRKALCERLHAAAFHLMEIHKALGGTTR